MKQIYLFALLIGLVLLVSLQHGQNPVVLNRFTVASGKGYFPRAISLPNGEVLVIMRGGAAHEGIGGRLEMIRFKRWKKLESPVIVVDGPYDDRNPAFGQLDDGTLLLAYSVLTGYDDSGSKLVDKVVKRINVMRSTDFGKTWKLISTLNDFPSGEFSPYGRILQLRDGTILMNIYGSFDLTEKPYKKTEGVYYSYLFRSKDRGQTWGDASLIGMGSETSLAVLEGGSLVAATRVNENKGIAISTSLDEGYTWSDPQVVTQPGELPADLLLVGDVLIMTYGKRTKPMGIAAKVSYDNGKSWDKELILADDALTKDCGYPSSIHRGDGKILTFYYSVDNLEKAPVSAHLNAILWKISYSGL